MTLIDRSTERPSPVADGTVPGVRRLYDAITPDDGTLLTRVLVRFRAVAFVVALCALSAVAGAELAERTAPGLCLDDACTVEVTPRRGDQVTVRKTTPGLPDREATVSGACLRGGPAGVGPGCPAWIWETAPRP